MAQTLIFSTLSGNVFYSDSTWEIPRDAPDHWPEAAKSALAKFWEARIARQKEVDASIAAKADFEYLCDKPDEDKKRVRVAGPFTVESLSPHRTQAVNEHGELIDDVDAAKGNRDPRAQEGETERRAGIFIGPEYGTVQRADLVASAREAADAGFDIVITCAFNYDAHTAEFRKLGRVPI